MGQSPKEQDDQMAHPAPDVPEPDTSGDFEYPHGWRLALVMIAIFTGMFLVALVRSE